MCLQSHIGASMRSEPEDTVVALPQRVSKCIHSLIEEQVVLQPDAPAIEAHDGHYTYSQTWATASALSNRLNDYGGGPESRAAILMEKSVHYTISLLAVLKSAAAFVPLDANHPLQRLQELYQQVEPFVLITTSNLLPLAQQLSTSILLVDVDQPQAVYTRTLGSSSPEPDNAAYIIFTSGSTGRPKGVVIEHAAFATSALARGKLTGLGPGSRVLQFAAHTFDVSVDEILTTLMHGGCVCVPSEVERFDIGSAITKLRVNHALMTPTSAAMLDPGAVPSLKTIQMGGELLSEEINNKWAGHARLFNVYGPTEASVASVMCERTGQKGAGHIIGLPSGSVCSIVHVDNHNQPLMPDTVGELVIGGHTLAREYLNDVNKTKAAFIDSPSWISWSKLDYPTRFYKTGDLASMDLKGFITIQGRKDNQIKLRGQRINVEEIEVALHNTELVHGVVVDLPKIGSLRNKLTAVVAEHSKTQGSMGDSNGATQSWYLEAELMHDDLSSALHANLQDTVPLAMIPLVWIRVPQLPQNSSAKTDRKSVKSWLEGLDELYLDRLLQADTKPQRREKGRKENVLETAMEAIWCKVLNVSIDRLRPNQSFVRNGGDSITAMELRSLAQNTGISLKVSDILKANSIRALIDSSDRVASRSTVHDDDDDAGKPFSLSPTQKFYFDATTENTATFTQHVCVEIKTGTSSATMRASISALILRHSMLRARFSQSRHNRTQWTTEHNDSNLPFDEHNLLPSQDLNRLVSDHVSSVSPFQGPVFHALLINRGAQDPVLSLVAHHLVVDFVSWRIILQDLEDLLTGGTLLPATLDYRTWCKLQSEWTDTLDATLVWGPPMKSNNTHWVSAGVILDNVYSNVDELTFNLPDAHTRALLYDCDNVQGARPVELILATLYQSFASVFPDRDTPVVFVESHGREPWSPSIDISRTVGWFTTAYPMAVQFDNSQDIDEAIFLTKRACRAFKDNGHAYWCCRNLTKAGRSMFAGDQTMEFVFNFSGRYQHLDRKESAFRRLSSIGEETAHPEAVRLSIFDILVSVEGEHMDFKISFPRSIAHKSQVMDWTEAWYRSLICVAMKCLRTSLDVGSKVGVYLDDDPMDMFPDAQEVYVVSSLQQHMLKSRERDPLFYWVIGTWRLEGRGRDLHTYQKTLRARWRRIVERHAALRTVFEYSKRRERYVGVVLKHDSTLVQAHLDAEESASSENVRLPHELTFSKHDDGSLIMRLEISHAIIDASSRDVLMEELFHAKDKEPIEVYQSSYTQYLEHLKANARQTRSLEKMPRCIFPANTCSDGTKPEAILQIIVPSLSITCDPFTVSRSMGVTFSSLVFTIWSLILSRYTACNSPSFAYTVSDRPRHVPHILKAAGCYIKLLTCSVEWDEHTRVFDVAHGIQVDCADCLSGDTRGVDASKNTRNGRSDGHLNTMVNVRNATTGSLNNVSGKNLPRMLQFEDPWDYDLTLSVNGSHADNLVITIDYRNTSITDKVAEAVAQDVNLTLSALSIDTTLTKYDWDRIIE